MKRVICALNTLAHENLRGFVDLPYGEGPLDRRTSGGRTVEGTDSGWITVVGAADGFAQEVTARGHHLESDEPVDHGGTDTGPTPYDLLLAGLGACTSMTVALYARRQGWPLTSVTVRLRHSKIHAKDCEACEREEGHLDRIEREITLEGELTEAQRAGLLSIASRCPVSRTLTSPISIRTRLTEGLLT